MTTKVDKFLGGLGIDATNKLEVASNATVTVGNGTATGNVHVGGNMSIGNISPGAHDLAIKGTSNFEGAVQVSATFTQGVNDQGYDFKLFGDTDGAFLLWDTSDNKLLTAGGTTIDIVKDKLLIGGTAVTTTATELNNLDAITRGSIIYGNASAATARLAKGGAGTVLTSDGTDIAWAASAGIGSVVADTSPQLGGTLDGNAQDIAMTTNKKLLFRDALIFINSSTDGQLDLIADALTKVSGNVALGTNASNTIILTGTLDCGTL